MNRVDNPLVRARELVKLYDGPVGVVEVLKGLNLDIRAGQSTALVGASGVGKSTLLHILGALDRPTEGRIEFMGRDIIGLSDNKRADFRNREVGFVFQFHHLLPEFTALENVAMPALVAGLSRKESYGRAAALLDQVGLTSRREHRIGEISGGEQQRVALARALVMEPKLLLADEPTGNLDTETGRQVGRLLIDLNKRLGLTTLVATHNLELAGSLDRLIRLEDGLAKEN